MFYKNKTGQIIPFYAESVADGTPATGQAENITAYISGGTGAFFAHTASSVTEKGRGFYYISPTQAETDYDVISLQFECSDSSVYIAPINIFTDPSDIWYGSKTVDGTVTLDRLAKLLLACTYAGGGGLNASGQAVFKDQSGSDYFVIEKDGTNVNVITSPS